MAVEPDGCCRQNGQAPRVGGRTGTLGTPVGAAAGLQRREQA